MNEDTYRDKLTDLQLEVEELRAKLKASQTGDLISREAAIDAICKACANGDDYVNCRDRDIKSRWCDNMVALRDLPSAHCDYCPYPDDYDGRVQVVRCKDCIYFNRNAQSVCGPYNGCEVWTDDGNEIEVKPDDYCSYAERRTDEPND